MRSLSILDNVPIVVTLLDLDGGALFQNDLSKRCVEGHLFL